MLENLGIDGMSSDESETEHVGGDYHTNYHILRPQWRAGRVTPWLRMFDSIHNILRRSGAPPGGGSFPRQRRATNRTSTNVKFVPGLPINAYDPEWIDKDIRRKYDLRPLRRLYDFNHDPDIVEYVTVLQDFFGLTLYISRLALDANRRAV